MKNIVKKIRIERGLSQQDLATALHVSRQTISYIENGQKKPTILLALRLAEFLQIPVDSIFELEAEDRPKPKTK
jgi:putative transcriptional regulator